MLDQLESQRYPVSLLVRRQRDRRLIRPRRFHVLSALFLYVSDQRLGHGRIAAGAGVRQRIVQPPCLQFRRRRRREQPRIGGRERQRGSHLVRRCRGLSQPRGNRRFQPVERDALRSAGRLLRAFQSLARLRITPLARQGNGLFQRRLCGRSHCSQQD